MSENAPRRTPLYDCHKKAGARMVDFAGWEMPVRYGSEIDEHHAVRKAAGLFDVSHMGEIHVHGEGATEFLQRITPNNVAKLKHGQAHYTGLLTEKATYVDDLLIYRLGDEDYLVVVNASNLDKDFAWMQEHHGKFCSSGPCALENVSDDYALLALQGPKAPEILARHTEVDLDAMKYYRFAQAEVCGVRALISRTGYTGELGFELYLSPDDAPGVWDALLESGKDDGLLPAGLGARDTLRLEAGMALYGHEIDDTVTPLEADLGWVVKFKKGDFIGRDVLVEQKENGPPRKMIGFEIQGRGIARQGYSVFHGEKEIALVTSGTYSPTFEKSIGTALVPPELAVEGTELTVLARKRHLPAVVVPLPFYKRD